MIDLISFDSKVVAPTLLKKRTLASDEPAEQTPKSYSTC